MRSSALVVLLILIAACEKPQSQWTLPAAIEGRWKLTATPPGTDGFGLAGALTRRKSVIGVYTDGSTTLNVFAFEQANGAAAFEQVQKWRAQNGKVAFQHGAWFMVLESPGLSVQEMSHIATAIEKTMPD